MTILHLSLPPSRLHQSQKQPLITIPLCFFTRKLYDDIVRTNASYCPVLRKYFPMSSYLHEGAITPGMESTVAHDICF